MWWLTLIIQHLGCGERRIRSSRPSLTTEDPISKQNKQTKTQQRQWFIFFQKYITESEEIFCVKGNNENLCLKTKCHSDKDFWLGKR